MFGKLSSFICLIKKTNTVLRDKIMGYRVELGQVTNLLFNVSNLELVENTTSYELISYVVAKFKARLTGCYFPRGSTGIPCRKYGESTKKFDQ